MNAKKFFSELKRRNVWKAAMAYIIASWVILQVLAVLLPAFEATAYIRLAFYFLVAAFPFWLTFSWIYEITSEGLKKTENIPPEASLTRVTGNRLNKFILAALGIAIVLLCISIFRKSPASAVEPEPNQLAELPDSLPEEKSIAVLAFADMSPKKDQEYFSDGISEEILNMLARIPELKVISRTSSFSFKHQNATTQKIGEVLGVNHILEGSVRKSGNTLRITAQLIDVSDGTHLWSKTFDRDMTDIFKIQDEIATEVTRELQAKLVPEALQSKVVDTEAYQLYLQARQLGNQFTRETTTSAAEILKRSIAVDSTYAPAWSLLSRMYHRMGFNFPILTKDEASLLGVKAADKAIELDPDYALSYASLAIFQRIDFDFTGASINAKKALELEPNNPEVVTTALVYNMIPVDKKIEALEEAVLYSPLDYYYYFNLGLFYYFNGDYKAAEESLDIYSLYFPNAALLHSTKGKILLAKGDPEAAYQETLKEEVLFFRRLWLTIILHKLGKQQEADKLLSEFIRDFPTEAVNIAQIYANRGDKDTAFEWLEKALAIKDPTLIEGLYYPDFKDLHKDPKWKDFIRRMDLPEGHGVPLG